MPKKISFFLKNPQVLNKKYLFILTVLLSTGIFLLPQPGQFLLASSDGFIKTFGGIFRDSGNHALQTSDGGYIIAGETNNFGVGAAKNVFVIKLDNSGDFEWARAIGGDFTDTAQHIQQTSDGGYIMAGKTGIAGNYDFFVVKLDSLGNFSWARAIGGVSDEESYVIQQTSDGGYIVAGGTDSYGSGVYDGFVVKLNNSGDFEWAKVISGWSRDDITSIQQTSDGGYILLGYTHSYGAGNYDGLLVKLDNLGNFSWAKAIGGPGAEFFSSIQQTSDGGYILAGHTSSWKTELGSDGFVVKLDNSGGFEWATTVDPSGLRITSIQQTSDGGYIVAGHGAGGGGGWDSFVFKLDNSGGFEWARAIGGAGNEWIQSIQQTSGGGYIMTGHTESYGAGDFDVFVIRLDGSGNISGCPLIYEVSPSIDSPVPIITEILPPVDSIVPNVAVVFPSVDSPSPTINTQCLFSMSTDPTVTTQPADPVGVDSATLNMDYTVGDYSPVEVRFRWKKTADIDWTDTAWVSRAANGSSSEDLIGLVASTEYHFKAQLRYDGTTIIEGDPRDFTTLSVAPPPPPPPGTCDYHSVWGWAWANMESPSHDPTIGWISFSCTSTMAIGTGVDYGVEIDPATGRFSGHAWSENIGWLSFNIGETGNLPIGVDPNFGTHLAQVSTTTGQVSGWARFLAACDSVPCTSSGPCANCGGWDGWIKLGNLPHQPWHAGVGQQVYIDFGAGPPSDFHGWAWGDDVVGWISFNCETEEAAGYGGVCAATNDYKVMTNLSFAPVGTPPTAAMSCDDAGCPGGDCNGIWAAYHSIADPPCSYTIRNESTDPDSSNCPKPPNPCNDDIILSRWYIKPFGAPDDEYVSKGSCPGICDYTLSFDVFPGNYTIKLYVEDNDGNWDEETHDLTVREEVSADFSCSLDNSIWVSCSNIFVEDGEDIYFGDHHTLPQHSIASEGTTINSREWRLNGAIISSNNSTNTSATLHAGSNIVRLTVTDSASRSDFQVYEIKVKFPLPEYREVRPRSQLDNFLARIAGIFR